MTIWLNNHELLRMIKAKVEERDLLHTNAGYLQPIMQDANYQILWEDSTLLNFLTEYLESFQSLSETKAFGDMTERELDDAEIYTAGLLKKYELYRRLVAFDNVFLKRHISN